MTTEEKAKAYDIALDKIKRLLGTGSNCSREDLEYVFPELAESEDEKIRKHLIGVVELYYGNTDEQEKKDCLAWLEKQGENSPVLSNSSNIGKVEPQPTKDRYMEGYLNGINDASKTQKSDAWSEEDDIMKQHCHQMLALLRPNSSELTKDIIDNCHHWLKSLKDRVQPQPQSQWKPSEEQISVLEFIMEDIEKDSIRYAVLNSVLEQLKKLREE